MDFAEYIVVKRKTPKSPRWARLLIDVASGHGADYRWTPACALQTKQAGRGENVKMLRDVGVLNHWPKVIIPVRCCQSR